MKIEEGMSGDTQHKTHLSLYKDEKALLTTAEVFHHFQCGPVVWIAFLVSNVHNHELEYSQSEMNLRDSILNLG